MNIPQATFQQLTDALRAVVAQCPTTDQDAVLSDLYLQPLRETCELLAYDDDDRLLARCPVPAWSRIDAEEFLPEVQAQLHHVIARHKDLVEGINLLRPFSFVLVDADHETVAELYLVDDDTLLLPGNLMEGLEADLDEFLQHLMAE